MSFERYGSSNEMTVPSSVLKTPTPVYNVEMGSDRRINCSALPSDLMYFSLMLNPNITSLGNFCVVRISDCSIRSIFLLSVIVNFSTPVVVSRNLFSMMFGLDRRIILSASFLIFARISSYHAVESNQYGYCSKMLLAISVYLLY